MVGDEDVILAYAISKYGPRRSIWVGEEVHSVGSNDKFSPFDDGTGPEDANTEGVTDEGSTKEDPVVRGMTREESSSNKTSRITAAGCSSTVIAPRWASENGGPRLWRCAKIPTGHDVGTVEETVLGP